MTFIGVPLKDNNGKLIGLVASGVMLDTLSDIVAQIKFGQTYAAILIKRFWLSPTLIKTL